VGTQLDQLTLFGNNVHKVQELETRLLKHLGIARVFNAVGQVYPRSLDFEVVSACYQLACGPSSFAKTLRLMAGHELASEGFLPGQVGSSAMPHKMNARNCERINGLLVVLRGYLTMAEGLSGEQWNEGDVSCSVVRRICLPDACFALDGLLETFLTVLDQMEANAAVIARENERYLPFLLTTTILMEAVKAGVGREQAHEAIKEHAVAAAKAMRSGQARDNDLFKRLAGDARLKLSHAQLEGLIARAHELTGAARLQTESFERDVAQWIRRFPESQMLSAEPLL